MPELRIRPYGPTDRDRVRHICFVTGYMGDPVDWLWRDAASFADLFTGYYTDQEPESAFVVTLDGVVSGYLLGCVDTRRAGTPAGALAHHALRRALLVRRGTAGVLWRGMADGIADLARGRMKPSEAELIDPRWPAHLHIDLLPEARGRGAGGRLMRAWFDRMASLGVPGVHLQMWAENASADAFFRAMGFEPHGRLVPMPGVRSPEGARHHTRTMVCSLPN